MNFHDAIATEPTSETRISIIQSPSIATRLPSRMVIVISTQNRSPSQARSTGPRMLPTAIISPSPTPKRSSKRSTQSCAKQTPTSIHRFIKRGSVFTPDNLLSVVLWVFSLFVAADNRSLHQTEQLQGRVISKCKHSNLTV